MKHIIIKTNTSGTRIESGVKTEPIVTKPQSIKSDDFGGLYRYKT